MTFDILTPQNSQRVTLSDNCGTAPTVVWIIARGHVPLWNARCTYAHMYSVPIEHVGYFCQMED
jgi:hypothetical protein